MDQFIPDFFKFYTIFIASIFFLLTLGYFLKGILKCNCNNDNHFETVFFCYLTGFLSITVLTAVVITKGKTILVLVPLIYILFLYENRNQFYKNNKIKVSQSEIPVIIGILLVISIVVFSCNYLAIYNPFTNEKLNIQHDSFFYAKMIKTVGYRGIETTSLNLINGPVSNTPYNYTAIWIGVFFTKFLNLNSIIIYRLLIIPLGCFGCFLGFLAISRKFISAYYFIGVLFIGTVWGWTTKFTYNPSAINILYSFSGEKVFVIVFILTVSFLFYLNKQIIYSYLALLFIVPLYSSAAPAVLSGGAFSLCSLYLSKKIPFKTFVRLLSYSLCVVTLFVAFYLINAAEKQNLIFSYTKDDLIQIYSTKWVFRYYFFSYPFERIISILLLPVIYCFIKFQDSGTNSKSIKENLYKIISNHYLLISYITGSFMGSLLIAFCYRPFSVDAMQIFNNSFKAFNIVFSVILIFYIISNIKTMRWLIFLLIPIVLHVWFSGNLHNYPENSLFQSKNRALKPFYHGINPVDKEFYDTIASWMSEDKKYNCAFLNSAKIYSDSPHDYNEFTRIPFRFLSFINDSYIVYKIGIHRGTKIVDNNKSLINKYLCYKRIASHAFFRYVQSQKDKLKFSTIEESQISFIKINNIKYLITDPDTKIPESFFTLIQDSIVNTDGWGFYKFKEFK